MKLGTENRNKTIVAGVLFGIALIFLARWLFMNPEDASPATRPTTVAAAPSANNSEGPQVPAPKRDRQPGKTLRAAWKPSLDPRLNLAMLKDSENITYAGNGRNIFEDTPEPEMMIPKPVASALIDKGPNVPPKPQGPPPPPPINLKFFGFAQRNGGQRSILLTQGDSVFVAREGDIIARRYKILRINNSTVEVQDMLTNYKQILALTAG